MNRLKILVFGKIGHPIYPFIKDFIVELGKHADVRVWSRDGWEAGYILKMFRQRGFIPDFIFHHDFAYYHFLSPVVHGLGMIDIPKGAYYIDLHTQTEERKEFVRKNKVDLVFSPTRDFFYRMLPELRSKFRWLPFSINPAMFKDWNAQKDIDFLLMGSTWASWYPFRDRVIKRMTGVNGFVWHRHPAETDMDSDDVFMGEKYAKEINRAKIFYTCGTKFSYPVVKYFEVPACNTLLIAKGGDDLPELGFRDGENFVQCNDENFYDLGMYYLVNEAERKRIAKNGYELVHSRHTNTVRARELIDMVTEYIRGTGSWK